MKMKTNNTEYTFSFLINLLIKKTKFTNDFERKMICIYY